MTILILKVPPLYPQFGNANFFETLRNHQSAMLSISHKKTQIRGLVQGSLFVTVVLSVHPAAISF